MSRRLCIRDISAAAKTAVAVCPEKGTQTFDTATSLQAPGINGLTPGLTVKDIQTIHPVLLDLRQNWKEGQRP